MKAVRFQGVGRSAAINEIPKPQVGPGQVLIKIGGAGVCHSDLHIMEEELGFSSGFTLGHENAGWIAELGQGVTAFKEVIQWPFMDPGGVDTATPANYLWRITVKTTHSSTVWVGASASMAEWPSTCLFLQLA